MSVKSFAHLVCDNCGAVREARHHSATQARIAAAAEGWQYAESGKRGRSKTWTVTDTCPACRQDDAK